MIPPLFLAEGRCEGRLAGRFRAANVVHRRADGVWLPQFRGVIEAMSGAAILTEYAVLAVALRDGRMRITGTALRHCDDEEFAWLSRVLCLVAGEADPPPPPFSPRGCLADAVWAQVAGGPTSGED